MRRATHTVGAVGTGGIAAGVAYTLVGSLPLLLTLPIVTIAFFVATGLALRLFTRRLSESQNSETVLQGHNERPSTTKPDEETIQTKVEDRKKALEDRRYQKEKKRRQEAELRREIAAAQAFDASEQGIAEPSSTNSTIEKSKPSYGDAWNIAAMWTEEDEVVPRSDHWIDIPFWLGWRRDGEFLEFVVLTEARSPSEPDGQPLALLSNGVPARQFADILRLDRSGEWPARIGLQLEKRRSIIEGIWQREMS